MGFAFENYDAIGKYRELDRGKPVNAADSYTLDGQLKSFTNGVELSQLLAEAKETHACYVQNMMSYLHGRPLAAERAGDGRLLRPAVTRRDGLHSRSGARHRDERCVLESPSLMGATP